MRDVAKYPGDALAARAGRLSISRPGVHQILLSVERKHLAARDADGKWSLTAEGRKWLRPSSRGAR